MPGNGTDAGIAARRSISRRRFVKATGASGVVAGLAGCTGGGGNDGGGGSDGDDEGTLDLKNRIVPGIRRYRAGRRAEKEEAKAEKQREERREQLY